MAQTAIEVAAIGPVELGRPTLHDTDEALCSQLFGVGVTRTNALASLVISGWVRGLSDRDIEAAPAEPVLAAWGFDVDSGRCSWASRRRVDLV